MTSFAVLGGGPMGLATALGLLEAGHAVELFEADDRLGGMTASFDFDGTRVERYYHFLCKTDYPLFKYAERLGISHLLRWQQTSMGYYYRGALHNWGTPQALLAFPHLSLVSKIRYGLHVLSTGRINDWSILEHTNARDWLLKWVGREGYEVLWKALFDLKFFEHADNLSAAWIGTRIKRIGKSRKSIFAEQLGYIEGGSEVLMLALGRKIKELGGSIHLKTPVTEVSSLSRGSSNLSVSGVRVGGEFKTFDGVVSTVPLPYVQRLVPTLPTSEKEKILAINNIGVVCVLLKLTNPITPHFWVNINEPGIEIPGLIEYTNLNPMAGGEHLVYLPYYMPQSHPKYREPSEWFYEEACRYLGQVNRNFSKDWVKAAHFHRYQYAQVVCPPGFQSTLPAMASAIDGLFYADTSYYYPEDRSMSESLQLGERLANTCSAWATEQDERRVTATANG